MTRIGVNEVDEALTSTLFRRTDRNGNYENLLREILSRWSVRCHNLASILSGLAHLEEFG